MNWFSNFLTSSIGRKLLMSLTGLFLIVFLLVHLIGNIQLLANDGGESFNTYAKFMTSNPLIKVTSYGLYFFIFLHAVQGILIWMKNKAARSTGYAVKVTRAVNTSATASSNMGWLGVIILVFIIIHMYQFWAKMHWGLEEGADGVKNLYGVVYEVYQNPLFVVFYVICMIIVAAHLWHGFQSAFQTLGLNHKKYSPFIRTVGKLYSVAIPLGFALIPILMYLGITLF